MSHTRLESTPSQLPLEIFFIQPARKQSAEQLFCGVVLLGTPALRIASLLENIFSVGINCMSLEMWWGEERKCSATVVDLDLVLALSKVRRCSLKRSSKRCLVSPMYCRWHLLH